MIVRALVWTAYGIPFAGTFSTAHGAVRVRQGLIVRLLTEDGLIGLGDAAPLPEFGGGSVEQAARSLRELAPRMIGRPVESLIESLPTLVGGLPAAAALGCALEVATLDLLAQARGRPLAALLSPSYLSSVPVNATIGARSPDEVADTARQAVVAGFQTVKLKVGVGEAATEVARVAAVRASIGSERALRLDANGAWTPETAIDLIRRFEPFQPELIEQPVSACDLAGLARVRAAVSTPIAADETVTGLEAACRIIQHQAADLLVIKPMVVGGLRIGQAIAEAAAEAGLHAVVTTTIDSGVGNASALHLAAALPDVRLACGLATAGLLQSDLLAEPLAVVDGRMLLPDRPGLGVVLDESALNRYRSAVAEPVTG